MGGRADWRECPGSEIMRTTTLARRARPFAIGFGMCALLAGAAWHARAEDGVSAAVPRVILLPALRVGGIPVGQVLQISERGAQLKPDVPVPSVTAGPGVTAAANMTGKPRLDAFCVLGL